MDAAFKRKLNKISNQLDADLQKALQGELDAVLAKYSKKVKPKKLSTRKIEQYERTKQKYNDWIEEQVETKSQRLGLKHLTKDEQYEELKNIGAVSRHEKRTHAEVTKRGDPDEAIDHAINRMKRLMTKKDQKKRLKMSRDAFRQAFNMPTGGAVDKQLQRALNSLNEEEWELFNTRNKDLIKKIWEWYKLLMKQLADPNFMLGKHFVPSIPTLMLDNVLTEISTIKTARKRRRR